MTELPERPEVERARAVFAELAAAVNALDPETAFEAARDLLDEYQRLASQAQDLRDVQVARIYESRRMTLAELAKVTRWGASRDGGVTRGRMSQIVVRGRNLLAEGDSPGEADPPPPDQPAA